jgi:UDP-2-acetamido-2-deoxy-ribo-hexuluronate aminotransferase
MNFIDLKEQYRRYKEEIRAEIDNTLEATQFIGGPALAKLETELASFCGAKHAIGCSSGTDGLILALMALDIEPGDEIIVPDFTFFATAETVSFLGAKPVFVDIEEDTYNINPDLIEAVITERTKGIIAVSLYGQCADFERLASIARKHNLFLIEDAAQSFGAGYNSKKSGNLCEVAITSFYPAKPLGAYGDGGALFTSSDELAEKIRMLLNHGQNASYKHRYIGINGRLDALQAAVLRVKLKHFNEELENRQQVAGWYTEALTGMVVTPEIKNGNTCSWAQYTVRSDKREQIIDHLKKKGIPVAIHYPLPVHKQEAYSNQQLADKDFPVAVRMSREVFSLPMHPFLTREESQQVASAIEEALS